MDGRIIPPSNKAIELGRSDDLGASTSAFARPSVRRACLRVVTRTEIGRMTSSNRGATRQLVTPSMRSRAEQQRGDTSADVRTRPADRIDRPARGLPVRRLTRRARTQPSGLSRRVGKAMVPRSGTACFNLNRRREAFDQTAPRWQDDAWSAFKRDVRLRECRRTSRSRG